MRVAIVGEKMFKDQALLMSSLDALFQRSQGDLTLITFAGHEAGPVAMARDWAKLHNAQCLNVKTVNGQAPNEALMAEQPELVVAFADKVSEDMIGRARAAGIHVVRPERT